MMRRLDWPWAGVAAWLLAFVPEVAWPQTPPRRDAELVRQGNPSLEERDATLVELRLLDDVLAEALVSYEVGREVLLPLGELARQLTLAIRTNPSEGTAEGFVLSEARDFHLSTRRAVVTLSGREEAFNPALVRVLPDDIYVASSLLSRWLPIDIDVNLSTLTLRVRPREQLPIQARLERERAAARLGRRAGDDRAYPALALPYSMLGVPYIDQTFSLGLQGGPSRSRSAAYSAYLTGDFAGMEGAAYVSSSRDKPGPDVRFTLGRHDPEGGLLGFLRARSASFGSGVSAPNVANIGGRTPIGKGYGVVISSRPLSQPTNFDRHTLEGELPPGWDVELYYNDALVGFQTSQPGGRYRFEDQPLAYGRNEFRLVFHGPLGQQRVERQSFNLEQAAVPAGDFYYTVSQHRDGEGHMRSVAQFDWGLNQLLTGTAGIVRLPAATDGAGGVPGGGLYSYAGLNGYWAPFIVGTSFYRSPDAGLLNESVVKTRIGRTAVSYSHVQSHDFVSEVFPASADPLRTRDTVRLDGNVPVGQLPPFPYTLEVLRERFNSGRTSLASAARVGAFLRGTAISAQLNWAALPGEDTVGGAFQVSRRVGATGLSAQLAYSLRPEQSVDTIALAAEQRLGSGYLLNVGLLRSFHGNETIGTVALNRDFGTFGLGVTGSRSTLGAYSLGLQLFIAIGRDPRTGGWRFDALPRADSGAASVRVYVDNNGNGSFDAGDEPVQNAAVAINGARSQARTDREGLLWLDRLPVHQNVDIGLDAQTLEDPTWQPAQPGVRLVSRPGKVAEIDFLVVPTSEVEGHVYVERDGKRRGIGNALVELVDPRGGLVASTRSSWDGYYVLSGMPRGTYLVRVAPSQLEQLQLQNPGIRTVTTRPDGQLIEGVDFVIVGASKAGPPPGETGPTIEPPAVPPVRPGANGEAPQERAE
jgi:hypothetical protein